MPKIVITYFNLLKQHRITIYVAVLAFISLPSSTVFAQNQSVSTSIGITRFDFFHSFEYEYQPTKFSFSAGIGYGINRSIFQKHFYPRITVGSTYYLVNKEKFQIGPHVTYALSFIRLTPNSKMNYWNEFNGGLQWSYGNKWKIGQTILVGYISESHFSTIDQKRVSAATINYYFSIALKYEI